MKKSTAVLSAFLIGVNCFASGAAAMAEQNEDKDVRKPAGVESLLVPQKLEVVLLSSNIDPGVSQRLNYKQKNTQRQDIGLHTHM